MKTINSDIVENIKHVVVLMLENRSFDHIFGDIPGVNGIRNAPGNHEDPKRQESPTNRLCKPYPIDVLAQPVFNPRHTFDCMMQDMFGPPCTGYIGHKPLNVVSKMYPTQTMCGFRANNSDSVMSYFRYIPEASDVHGGRLKVLHTLAENFVVCDNWFCDTPTETVPNRLFMHAATNKGYNADNSSPTAHSESSVWRAKTIYEVLDDINPTGPDDTPNWAMYGWHSHAVDYDWFKYLCGHKGESKRCITRFSRDVEKGKLPFYTFLIPSLNCIEGDANGNSMHPDADVRLGENFVAQVYNTLRNSSIWHNTLLIINFDENGGIYDHVTPPYSTPPDDATYPVGKLPLFDYSVLGPRIPALLISPWLANTGGLGKFTIDSTPYQNTSVLRFVQDLFAAQKQLGSSIGSYYLTERDRTANSLTSAPWLKSPRTDCPLSLGIYSGKDIHGNEIAPWGTCLPALASPCHDGASKPDTPPDRTTLHLADAYLRLYPGHADSGRRLMATFKTKRELAEYIAVRKRAARTHAELDHSGSSGHV